MAIISHTDGRIGLLVHYVACSLCLYVAHVERKMSLPGSKIFDIRLLRRSCIAYIRAYWRRVIERRSLFTIRCLNLYRDMTMSSQMTRRSAKCRLWRNVDWYMISLARKLPRFRESWL